MNIEGPSHVPQPCAPASHQRHSQQSRSLVRTPNWRKHINRANRCRRAVAHTHVSYRKQVDKIHICGHVHVCEALRFSSSFSSSCVPRADGMAECIFLYSGGCVVFQLPLFWLSNVCTIREWWASYIYYYFWNVHRVVGCFCIRRILSIELVRDTLE